MLTTVRFSFTYQELNRIPPMFVDVKSNAALFAPNGSGKSEVLMLLPLLQSSVPELTGPFVLQTSTATLITQSVQAFGVIAALLFTGLQFRARVHEQRFQDYRNAVLGFLDLQKLMIEKKELHELYELYSSEQDLTTKTYKEMSPDDRALIHYCDALIALHETVWRARQNNWLKEEEFKYWRQWVQVLNRSAHFRWTVNWVEKSYFADFIKYIHSSPPET